ncbi:MAG: acetate/propionate family kinase [Rhizobium sp.]|nr:acetate/propionate family kinase [Rhizobium sp.]
MDWFAPDAAAIAVEQVLRAVPTAQPTCIVHRVVHGGRALQSPLPVTPAVRAEIARLADLAPLHNPVSLALLDQCSHRRPTAQQIAVFDTAFHHTLPEDAALYAIPGDLAERLQIRRYGFHGISHASVARRASAELGRPAARLNIISLHLGHGASACAIAGGRSIDTSMGMTPTEGLVMASRCGDLDPGALLHLLRTGAVAPEQIDHLLNHESGLRGLCGQTDMRQIRAAADAGEPGARRALGVYVHRIRRYIGAYFAVLGRVDALVFTGGVGENDTRLREEACATLAGLGVLLDPDLNGKAAGGIARVSLPESRVAVLVIPANEEQEMMLQALPLIALSPEPSA